MQIFDFMINDTAIPGHNISTFSFNAIIFFFAQNLELKYLLSLYYSHKHIDNDCRFNYNSSSYMNQ